jgi:hypothetical protein
MRIIYRLCANYIMYYLSPCPRDNQDNADVFFELKKMGPPYLEAPPLKNLATRYGKRKR